MLLKYLSARGLYLAILLFIGPGYLIWNWFALVRDLPQRDSHYKRGFAIAGLALGTTSAVLLEYMIFHAWFWFGYAKTSDPELFFIRSGLLASFAGLVAAGIGRGKQFKHSVAICAITLVLWVFAGMTE